MIGNLNSNRASTKVCGTRDSKPEPKPASNPDAKPTDETAQKADGKATPKPMTRQEVERLLQRIRDKERARLLEGHEYLRLEDGRVTGPLREV